MNFNKINNLMNLQLLYFLYALNYYLLDKMFLQIFKFEFIKNYNLILLLKYK